MIRRTYRRLPDLARFLLIYAAVLIPVALIYVAVAIIR